MISHKLVTAVTRLLRRLWARRLLVVALGAGLSLGLATFPAQADPTPQEGEVELLQNPSFEDGFYLWNGNNSLQLGTGWMPWWIDNSEHDPPYTRPEYSRVGADDAPVRVHSGENAQQWFKLHSSYYAGVYQQVPEVTPEVGYRFSLWAQVWSSQEDEPEDVSSNPVNPHLQIGIDPQGNVDPFSADIIWSYEAGMHEVIDGWSQLTVEALARNSSVTVFVRSRPEFANKHNNVFIDSASLQVVVPATATPTVPPPTFTPTVTPTVAASPTATATVVVTETVTAAPPTVAAAPTITSTTAVTSTRPVPTDTPIPEANPTQPPQPTAAPPTETETAPPPPTVTNIPVVTNTPPLPMETQAATEAVPTATVTAEVAVTETALPTGTAVAMVSPTAVEEVTAPAPAPEESGDTASGRGLLCTAPILVIGLFGLALVLVRRRFLAG